MLEKDHGHIVSIASSAGLVGVNGLADYCASKFAAVGKLSSHKSIIKYLSAIALLISAIFTIIYCEPLWFL